MQKFEKEYLIRSYEGDRNGDLRLVTLMNIFQDAADNHATQMNLGMEYCLSKNLAWMGSNYHILIKELPKIHQKIKVRTWPSEEKKLGAIRDFVVLNEEGKEIIVASSQWILIDVSRRRPVSLKENLPQYQVVPERSLQTDFPKIEDFANETVSAEFQVRLDDIDFNHHVNNSIYPLWAVESLEKQYCCAHHPKEIEISFKKECLLGETVLVYTNLEKDISIHKICAKSDGRELARIKIAWKNEKNNL